jgi:hypothetical protein
VDVRTRRLAIDCTLVDIHRKRFERKTGSGQEIGPPGRRGRQNQSDGQWTIICLMEPIDRAVPGAVAELLRSAPLSAGKVEFAWKAAVGPAMGSVTFVRLEAGTLLVEAATSAWAREVSRATPMVLRRLQSLLGRDIVRGIVVRPVD